MQSVYSRPQPLGSSATVSSYRVPRKSSSFLSLRREKDKSSSPDPNTTPELPHSTRPTYFDAYPRPKTSPNARPAKAKGHRTSSSIRTAVASSTEASYAFPSFDTAEDVTIPMTPNPYSRTRSRTGPSRRSTWKETSSIPQLRFSGSSTQHTETPPHTPVDFSLSRESLEQFPVVVAAPIAGVETMDALVDGMNGGDDILSSTSMSSRARFGIPGHHPLYQPPLPTPPPGVVLGGGKLRRPKPIIPSKHSSDSEDDDTPTVSASRPRRWRTRPSASRSASNSTITPPQSTNPASAPEPTTPSYHPTNTTPRRAPSVERPKSIIPSISEIIRTHAPLEGQLRSRPSTARSSSYCGHSQGHATVHEEPESEPEPLTLEEEAELLSRSSIDSVADEVQRTLRHQIIAKPRPPPAPPSSFPKRHSTISDNTSIYSPRSDPGAAPSICSSSLGSHQPPSPFDTHSFISFMKPSSVSQEVATYLRSARLTTLLRLTRSPHASQDNPLTVSLSDLGNPTGYPVVVFLGLGCVRHIMGLYDEMAEILNLRLITIDRWGLGRTEPRAKSAKGIMQWASVVEEVLDLLHIGQCSVMAHSAGAPYALSFANKLPKRIRGEVCLLAPWVGGTESNGYKWLKYVPNGILKTAQAAEWKIQAWMIGKPPTIAFEGIGYNADPPASKLPSERRASSPYSHGSLDVHPPLHESRPRPSIGSSTFSEYDDLGDFDGRFESRSTLGAGGSHASRTGQSADNKFPVNKRTPSRGFLNRLKRPSHSPQSPPEEKSIHGGRTLKALRSMGSLKGRSASAKKIGPPSPQLPPSLQIEVGLGFSELDWTKSNSETFASERDPFAATPSRFSTTSQGPYRRSDGRRSISFTSPNTTLSMPSSPSLTATNSSYTASLGPNSAYQAALGNALIAASHSESAKGTHNDLLQILNHDNHPWGFSYSSYPHSVKVWYGDRDEKIAENAVRWMARTMGEDRCSVKVIKGADHGLMYRSSVVVEVLEHLLAFWKPDK
ncbi:hypothetical protein Hypma_015317 [Hypsizygus marmoreus]|uniref:AB hydrolase-1 domain-containing protein n=1 Tax=Hypsizygus marmoreus TaxID=39966 RepID=A0A369K9C4_HYPMA|nr:hypothetical protein Hypma_015317 [Hypsizygus marmoreus]